MITPKTNNEKPRNLAELRKKKNYEEVSTKTEVQITEMLKNKYDEVREFRNYRYAAVRKGDKRGFVDTKGKEICDVIYDEVKDFEFNRYAPVKLDGKWGLATHQDIDGKGSKFFLEFPCKYDDLINMYDSTFAFKQDGKWGVIDLNGEILIPCEYDDLKIIQGHVHTPLQLQKGGKLYEIDPRTKRDIEKSFSKYEK